MTTTALAIGKLGKLPVRTDVRTLRLKRYVDATKLPEPPPAFDLTAHVPDWPMYANDRRGDCTTAAAGHMIEAWTAAASGEAVEIAESEVLTAFDEVRVVDPLTGEEGAIELDVLRLWRRQGIGRHRIGAYAAVARYEHDLVRAAAWLFGGLYIGLALPLSARRQDVWDWTGSLSGDAKPGSWGGHAVDVVRVDPSGLTVVTWGRLQLMTWAFWDRYCDEAYAILSRDFLAHGRAPNGFDLPALKTDLELVTAP
jgi:GNAT superfamily N-acetyltransferase